MKSSILLLISIYLIINISNVLVYGQDWKRVCKHPNLSDETMNEFKKSKTKCRDDILVVDECEKDYDFTNDNVKEPRYINTINRVCSEKYAQCQMKARNATNFHQEQDKKYLAFDVCLPRQLKFNLLILYQFVLSRNATKERLIKFFHYNKIEI